MWKTTAFQVAYEENYFNYHKRNKTQAIRHLKAAFIHAQTAFCDPSFGTKVHINVQNANDPIYLKGLTHKVFAKDSPFNYFQKP